MRSLQLSNAPLTCLALQPQEKQMGSLPSIAFAGSQSSQVRAFVSQDESQNMLYMPHFALEF